MFFADEEKYEQGGNDINISKDETVTWEDVLSEQDDLIPMDQTTKSISNDSNEDFIPALDDEVSDDELARILNSEEESSAIDDTPRQKAFDTFGTKEPNAPLPSQEELEIERQLAQVRLPDEDEDDGTGYIEEEQEPAPKVYNIPKQNAQAERKTSTPMLLLLLAVVVAFASYCYFSMFSNSKVANKKDMPQQEDVLNNEENNVNDADIPIVNDEEIGQISPDTTVSDEQKEVVEVHQAGRSNPFMPLQKYIAVSIPETVVDFSKGGIPAPPKNYGAMDERVEKMISIAVSGIMYDDQKPSAIITFDDNDYFVQVGDKLDDYKVLEIGKSYVVIALGRNTYRANIGEEFKVSDFYGNAPYLPKKQGGGRQYRSVSDIDTYYNERKHTNERYVSEEDVEINIR